MFTLLGVTVTEPVVVVLRRHPAAAEHEALGDDGPRSGGARQTRHRRSVRRYVREPGQQRHPRRCYSDAVCG